MKPSIFQPVREPDASHGVVLGTGLLALDIVMSDVSGEPKKQWAGGTCGNVLIALAYLGWKAKPVARLRTGRAADRVLLDLREWGVSDEFVSIARDGSTPVIFEKITQGPGHHPQALLLLAMSGLRGAFPGFKSVLSSVAEEVAQERRGPGLLLRPRLACKHHPCEVLGDRGGLVVFEPSSVGNTLHFRQAWETLIL